MATTLHNGIRVGHGYTPNVEHGHELAARMYWKYPHALTYMMANDDNADRYNYRTLVACLRDANIDKWLVRDGDYVRLNTYNQTDTSSCAGNARSMQAALELAHRVVVDGMDERFTAMPAPEVQYALGLEVDGSLGDAEAGCSGSGMVEGSELSGVGFAMPMGTHDLSAGNADGEDVATWSKRLVSFATHGVPADVRQACGDHRAKSHRRIRATDEAWAAIGSGYAILTCSNRSYDGKRNEEGIIRCTGNEWPHAMCVSSRRTSPKYGRLYLVHQSWQHDWTSGPYWLDQPIGSFWITEADYASMLTCQWNRRDQIQDCWISTGVAGFPRAAKQLPHWTRRDVLSHPGIAA